MKKVVIYTSTITGNTKKITDIGERVFKEAGVQTLHRMSAKLNGKIPGEDLDADLFILGFWCRKGTVDDVTAKLLALLSGKRVALAGTMGASPERDYGKKVPLRAGQDAKVFCDLAGVFVCQGKIDEKRTERRRALPVSSPHYLDDEGYERHLKSRSHPDEEDLLAAEAFFDQLRKETMQE